MQIVANNLGNAFVPDLTGDVDVSDNRTPRHRLVFEQDPAPGTIVSVGTHTITVTVTDLRGNSRDCHQTLEVVALASQEPVNILDPTESTGTVVELEVEAETNFDGSEVILTWTFPDGIDASSTVFIQRDGLLIATATGTTYTDTTVESGETYVYLVTVSTLAGGTTTQCCIVPPGTTVFSNTAQTATVSCPVGTTGASKSVTVPANTFTSSSSQADADALALASATAQANALLCCCEICEDGLVLYDDCFPYGYGYGDCLTLYDGVYPYGYGCYPPPTIPSYVINHWWKMNECGLSVRRDAIGTADLIQSGGGIDCVPGKVGNATVQLGTNLQTTTTELNYFNNGMTLFGWFKMDRTTSLPSTWLIDYEFLLAGLPNDRIRIQGDYPNSLITDCTYSIQEHISADPIVSGIFPNAYNTWIFFIATHNGANGSLTLEIKTVTNHLIITSPTNWTPVTHTNARIFFYGAGPLFHHDECGIIYRILTQAEKDFLWNGGAGRSWPFA